MHTTSVAVETVERDSGPDPDRTVIWLHGLGADGHDFEPVVPELRLPPAPGVRFVFPHAPVRPVTLNGGLPMRAWYDILQLGAGPQDGAGVRASQAIVQALIEREQRRGVPPSRIVLAGFSQGGAMALHTGLRMAQPLAGILALSTYLPVADTLAAEADPASRRVPVFMAHGTLDPVIGLPMATASRDVLKELGYDVQWHTYPMAHSVCPQEIDAVAAWLRDVLHLRGEAG